MSSVTVANKSEVKKAMNELVEAAMKLGNVMKENDYEFSDSVPEYIKDIDDFTYDLITTIEDEFEFD